MDELVHMGCVVVRIQHIGQMVEQSEIRLFHVSGYQHIGIDELEASLEVDYLLGHESISELEKRARTCKM